MHTIFQYKVFTIKPLNAELKPICYLLALLAHHFLHVSRIRLKSLTLRLLSYIYMTLVAYGLKYKTVMFQLFLVGHPQGQYINTCIKRNYKQTKQVKIALKQRL